MPSNQEGNAHIMKSRVFTLISLLVLAVAMVAAPSASAESPAQNVYNPNGEVLDVVDGGGERIPDVECTEADGLDADGNSVPEGSAADCRPGTDDEVCAAADGRDGDGNTVAYGSEADCSNGTTPSISEGELPFTGFEAGMVGVAGMLLLGAGMAVRRLSRHES
jgi:hypothetical protein